MLVWIKIKQFFLGLLTPVQKLLQRTGRQESPVTPQAVNDVLKLIEPGDTLVSCESGRPTSVLIKGWDHNVIYGYSKKIVESVGDKFEEINGVRVNVGGVREVDLVKWLYQLKSFALIRPNLPKYIREAASKNALKFIGTSYDYKFEYGPEKLYCSELTYVCYRAEDRNFMADIGPNEEILPQEYYDRCGKDFILLYEFKG
jgi:hypothetical protein